MTAAPLTRSQFRWIIDTAAKIRAAEGLVTPFDQRQELINAQRILQQAIALFQVAEQLRKEQGLDTDAYVHLRRTNHDG